MHWKDLEVWKKAHSLVLEIYNLTAKFPKNESFALVDQQEELLILYLLILQRGNQETLQGSISLFCTVQEVHLRK